MSENASDDEQIPMADEDLEENSSSQGTIHIFLYSTKLNFTPKFFTKLVFRQNKEISFSTLHFDKIFMLQFDFLVNKEENVLKIRENVVVD